MSTTPLDDLRVEVAAARSATQSSSAYRCGPRRPDLGSSHAKSLDSWASTSANSSALRVCANARKTPASQPLGGASRAFRTVIYRTWPTGR